MSAMSAVGGLAAEAGMEQAGELIGAYIARQRWSGAAGKRMTSVRIVDIARLDGIGAELYFTVTRVAFDDGRERDYALPLGVRPLGDPLAERAPDFMIGPLQRDSEARFLYDALGDPDYVHWLWRAFQEGRELRSNAGVLRFVTEGASALDADPSPPLRVLSVEQSNTSLIVGDRTFFKYLRRVEPGPSHELEMLEALGRAGFRHMAPLQASALYAAGDAAPSPLIMVQPFLHNGTDGWLLALTSLRDLYSEAEDAIDAGTAERLGIVDEHGGAFTAEAARLGAVTAEMHLALTSPSLGDAVAPTPLTERDLNHWADAMTAEVDTLLQSRDPVLERLRAERAAVVTHFDELRGLHPSGLCTRVHGDLHLGQTLRTDSGWVILDFEGEPDRTPLERRERSSALRDVAGMLRSFDYAAAVALAERLLPESADWEGMLAFGDAWARVNRDAFWSAYLETANGRGLLPDGGATLAIRRAFEVQKAVYEVRYELGHRPAWATIPLRFLLRGTS